MELFWIFVIINDYDIKILYFSCSLKCIDIKGIRSMKPSCKLCLNVKYSS